jgi:glyoxalase family protein
VQEAPPRFGEAALLVADPSGLAIELVEAERDRRAGWAGGGVDAGAALRGLHSVALTVRTPAPTMQFLADVLGFRTVNETEGRTRLSAGGDDPGHWLDVVHGADAPAAVNGLGTVHHVALAIASDSEQIALRDDLARRGIGVTDVRDRCYFQSIYFREPGGVLLEVATVQPGFTVDEDVARLGASLKLPPWEEPHRQDIERSLAPVIHRQESLT